MLSNNAEAQIKEMNDLLPKLGFTKSTRNFGPYPAYGYNGILFDFSATRMTETAVWKAVALECISALNRIDKEVREIYSIGY